MGFVGVVRHPGIRHAGRGCYQRSGEVVAWDDGPSFVVALKPPKGKGSGSRRNLLARRIAGTLLRLGNRTIEWAAFLRSVKCGVKEWQAVGRVFPESQVRPGKPWLSADGIKGMRQRRFELCGTEPPSFGLEVFRLEFHASQRVMLILAITSVCMETRGREKIA